SMTVSPSIPATVEIRRSRLLLLVAAVAIAAAAISWGATSASESSSGSSAQSSLVTQLEQYGRGLSNTGVFRTPVASSSYATAIAKLSRIQQAAAFGGPGATLSVLYGLSPTEAQYVRGITSMTPAQQAAAFGR